MRWHRPALWIFTSRCASAGSRDTRSDLRAIHLEQSAPGRRLFGNRGYSRGGYVEPERSIECAGIDQHYGFLQADAHLPAPATRDQIYAQFIWNNLPPGVACLVIAAILAAGMSNLSAALNA